METLKCRFFPWMSADGPANMATDEAMLDWAAAGEICFRFYGWSEPTLSLGYFQHSSVRRSDPLLSELPFVRRPTGGDTLVHNFELTYALALPPGLWRSGEPWLQRMHQVIARALSAFGVHAKLYHSEATATDVGPLCFHHFAEGDLILDGSKIAGSAQRRRHGALLQHGGILLVQSPFTPSLPGIFELQGKLVRPEELQREIGVIFEQAAGFELCESEFSAGETATVSRLTAERYRSPAWNNKR